MNRIPRVWNRPPRGPSTVAGGERLRRAWIGLAALALVFVPSTAPVLAAEADEDIPPAFARRCQTLPPTSIEVTRQPVTFHEDDTQSYATLAERAPPDGPRHRTIGLTEARLTYASTLETRGIEERPGGRICARPRVRVVLTMMPMTVYVAREYASDACRRTTTLAHEMRHVEVFRAFLDEAKESLARELPPALGTDVQYARDRASGELALEQQLKRHLGAFLERSGAALQARQAAIDSPQEYARLDRACSSAER